jgi:predicted Holliday junction resolvase-like endonuclease
MLWAIVILGVIIVLLLLLVVWLLRKYSDTSREYSDLSGRYDRDIAAARADSVKQSRAVHLGGIAEQIAPLLPGFPYDPKDCRWAGQPIDMIVFDGLEGGGDIDVVFLEIKTGKSQRNKNQRRVKTAVEAGRVGFAEYRPDRQWADAAVEALEPEPALSPGEREARLLPSQIRGKTPAQKRAEALGDHSGDGIDDGPDWEEAARSIAVGDVEVMLSDEDWEDEVTDFVVAADPPPGWQRAAKNRPRAQ